MSFLRPSQTEARRRRILVGGASVLVTAIIMTAFMLESRSGYSGRVMNVIYMQSWKADRSRDDTIADAKANTVLGVVVANAFDGVACHLDVVDVRVGGDFTCQNDQTGVAQSLGSNAA